MSYEIVKSIRFDKKNNSIKICSADSSLRPLRYQTFEFVRPGQGYDEAHKSCFLHFMDGNLQYNQSRKPNAFRALIDSCHSMKRRLLGDVYGFDLEYKSTFNNVANDILNEELVLPGEPNFTAANRRLSALFPAMQTYREEYQAKLVKEGKIRVFGASMSFIYEGYDVFIGPDDDETIVAPKENYHNDGILDNAKNDAIFLGKGTKPLWHYLRFDGYGDKSKQDLIDFAAQYDRNHPGNNYTQALLRNMQLLEQTVRDKLAHLTMTKLPYKDFAF